MTKQERIAFRILASLYPDRKPSEIRKIIDKALEKEENSDDIELWSIMTRETSDKEIKKEEPAREKVIERHYYHNHSYWPYSTTCDSTAPTIDTITICGVEGVSNTVSAASNCGTATIADYLNIEEVL